MTKAKMQKAVICIVLLAACGKPRPLTLEKARAIIAARSFSREPVYAEVPQRVWWNPGAPKDDFDEKSIRTLENLERAGLVTVTRKVSADGTTGELRAKVTRKGFPVLGTAPSYRGPVYRGRIAEKVYDGIRNFERHPTDPTVAHAELVWHYDNATWLYPLFDTKINKPLKKPFASLIAFYYNNHDWKFDVTVRKAEPLTVNR